MLKGNAFLVPQAQISLAHRVSTLVSMCFVVLCALALWCPRRLFPRRLVAWSLVGEPFAGVWAGWSLCGAMYVALQNLHVRADINSVLTACATIAVDVFAIRDQEHWTPLVHGLLALDAATLVVSAQPYLVYSMRFAPRFCAAIHVGYISLTLALLVDAPGLVRGTRLADEPLAAAFAEWRMCSSAFYALILLGLPLSLADAVAMGGAAVVALGLTRAADGDFNPLAGLMALMAAGTALLATLHVCGMGWLGRRMDAAILRCLRPCCLPANERRRRWGRVSEEETEALAQGGGRL